MTYWVEYEFVEDRGTAFIDNPKDYYYDNYEEIHKERPNIKEEKNWKKKLPWLKGL